MIEYILKKIFKNSKNKNIVFFTNNEDLNKKMNTIIKIKKYDKEVIFLKPILINLKLGEVLVIVNNNNFVDNEFIKDLLKHNLNILCDKNFNKIDIFSLKSIEKK